MGHDSQGKPILALETDLFFGPAMYPTFPVFYAPTSFRTTSFAVSVANISKFKSSGIDLSR